MKLGFCVVPSLLLRAQRRLGLSPTQLAVVMQLADYWWQPDRKPYPTKRALAERLGLSERQVQRHVAELEDAGLVQRTQRFQNRRKLSNTYDLSGLVAKLNALAPEFIEAERKVKKIKELVAKPGGLKAVNGIND